MSIKKRDIEYAESLDLEMRCTPKVGHENPPLGVFLYEV